MILSACGSQDSDSTSNSGGQAAMAEPEFSRDVRSFSFTNQDEETVSLEDLEGTYWIADMIFTNCDTVCPPMTANMAYLQDQVEEAGLSDEVRFVSFSVDPTVDSPSVLKDFAMKHEADFSNWDFLTGYSNEEIKEFSIKSFQLLVQHTDQSDQVTHGTNFMLVNPDGKAIERYKGMQRGEMERIVADLESKIESS